MADSMQDLLVSLLADTLQETIASRTAGHCIRVDDVPREVADRTCTALTDRVDSNDQAVVVTADPTLPHHRSPGQVVELRNLSDEPGAGVLTVFVPPNELLAVEDSIGISTFERVSVDLGTLAWEEVMAQLQAENPSVARDIATVGEILTADPDRFEIDRNELPALALEGQRLLRHGHEEAAIAGSALPIIGLLPDSLLCEADDFDEIRRRLELNAQQMEALTQPIAPADRIRSLPVDREAAPELLDALLSSVSDGTTDQQEISSRLATRAEEVDLGRWDVDPNAQTPERFEVNKILGADHTDGDWTVLDDNPSLGVEFVCEPAAKTFLDATLRLDILALGAGEDEGVVKRVEKKSGLPAKTKGTLRKKVTCGHDEAELRPGLYRIRLSLLSFDGRTLKAAESEHFRVGEIEPDLKALAPVSTPFEALLRATVRFKKRPGEQATLVEGGPHEPARAEIGFSAVEDVSWPLDLDARLLEVEADLLAQPTSVRGRSVNLAGDDPGLELLVFENAPDAFLDARKRLFEEFTSACRAIAAESQPSLSFIDTTVHEAAIKDYVSAWLDALSSDEGPTADLLEVDRIEIRQDDETKEVLVAPTHPLRLAWRLAYDRTVRSWIDEADELDLDSVIQEATELLDTVPDLVGEELPLVVTSGQTSLRFRHPLPGGWTGYQTLDQDAGQASLAARWLGARAVNLRGAGERELESRVRAYLESHPYVRTLVVNVVQGGRGDFMLRLLGTLAGDRDELRFVVRFFGDDTSKEAGLAFDEFMADPESTRISQASRDHLSRASGDPLRPRLAFSKHTFNDLRLQPSLYPAHLTVFLDYFEAGVHTAPVPDEGRSIFGNGLITGARSQFRPATSDGETPPRWISQLLPDRRTENLVQTALAAHERHTAASIGSSGAAVPTLRLELDVRTQAILDAVHELSDWVITIDPIFSDQYLDPGSQTSGSDDRYVVDVRDIRSSGEARNVVISSKLRREQSVSLVEAARHFDIAVDDQSRSLLVDGLHILGAGLGLRLLADNTKRIEAFSLALASSFLRHQGFLRHALIIPIDEYPDLIDEARRRGEVSSLSRTDLLIVRLDPNDREIAATLVEVKVRNLGAGATVPESLADEMREQLENTEPIVMNRLFGVHLRERPNSLAAALRLRRLSDILRRHLARAARHGYVPTDEAAASLEFLDHLDKGLTFSIDLRGLIFNVGGSGAATQTIGGIEMDVVGSETVIELLASPPAPTSPPPSGRYLRTVMEAQPHSVQITEGDVEFQTKEPISEKSDDPPKSAVTQDEDSTEPLVALSDVDLIGRDSNSSQFSVIGRRVDTEKPAALDIGGTNVISLFGVQGSGKSYTSGVIIEAGLLEAPELGPLPNPLATVVFHYSQDSSYRSEFASMAAPAATPVETPWAGDVDASPQSVEEVVVLVPPRQLNERRRSEYPDARVEPLAIGPTELTTGDWKLLMGIEGGRQMYAKALNQVLKGLPAEFKIEDLRSAIEDSTLSAQQRSIAGQRVEFVAEYLSDGARIVDWIQPGRLVIVDLRDEYIDKDEALALFMVLLNRFAEAQREDSPRFNKMIVFDEAHKYMRDSTLGDAITEAVREMRHKGVSLVIASQDPPSIPAVILELSTVIVTHKMTSPTWLKHLQKHNAAFADITTGEVAQLRPGSAFLWSAGGSNRFRYPQRIETRSRLTTHGGGTVRADS